MKTILALLLSLSACLGQSVNLTNVPAAKPTSTNDVVLGMTNASPNIANAKMRLISLHDLFDWATNYDAIFCTDLYADHLYGNGSGLTNVPQIWTNDIGFWPERTNNTFRPMPMRIPGFFAGNAALEVATNLGVEPNCMQFQISEWFTNANQWQMDIGTIVDISAGAYATIAASGSRSTNGTGQTDSSISLTANNEAINCYLLAQVRSYTNNTPGLCSLTLNNGNPFMVTSLGADGDNSPFSYTSNSVVIAALGSSGVWTNQGNYYPSNATPPIPTAADLGAGGFWTGNSNGSLVTVYSLNGSTTVMKILAP